MSFLEMCGAFLALCFALYMVVRVVTAAFYQSRRDFERSDNGTQRTKQPR